LASIICLMMVLESSSPCKIMLTIISKTVNPFLFQAIVPAIRVKTAITEFVYKEQTRVTVVEGMKCHEKRWILKTWKKLGSQWVAAKERRMKLDGNGRLNITVFDNYVPILYSRMGIVCSFGPC
ncbi:hypothetical protein Tcan_00391, partial [Toxocara canis]